MKPVIFLASLLQPIPAYSRQFHPISSYFCSFPPISACSSPFQLIPAFSSLSPPIPGYIPAHSSLIQLIQAIHNPFTQGIFIDVSAALAKLKQLKVNNLCFFSLFFQTAFNAQYTRNFSRHLGRFS